MIAEQRAPELLIREKLRRSLLLLHVLQPLLLENRDFVGRQSRVHRHIGQQVDELWGVLREPSNAERREIL